MRKSRAETAETRKRIIATSANVFLRQGIAATGVADLMVAAGLTAGGFYRHFESKEQLVAEANALAFQELFAMFDTAVAGKAPQEALQIIVHRYLYQLHAEPVVYLCPLANLTTELQHADEIVKGVASEGYAALVKLIAAHLMRMDVVDYVGTAESIVATIVGAVSLSRLTLEASAAKAILANAEQTVGLLVHGAGTSKTLSKAKN
jgi:TetR/AcrR family transcriptional repressor of nem operon